MVRCRRKELKKLRDQLASKKLIMKIGLKHHQDHLIQEMDELKKSFYSETKDKRKKKYIKYLMDAIIGTISLYYKKEIELYD